MSMSEQAPRQHGRKNAFRTLAAVSTAAILLGSSFYAAQAGTAGFYNDDGDADDTAETAGIVAGAGLGVFLIAGAIDRSNDKKSKSEDKEKSAKALPVEKVRLLSSSTGLTAGDSTVVRVQAQYPGSKTWTDVTDNAGIRLVSGDLTQVDGSKNAFAVPYGSKAISGPATVEASFGGQTATAEIQVN
jgi:hypothetical protein